jgi:hypothetical protein
VVAVQRYGNNVGSTREQHLQGVYIFRHAGFRAYGRSRLRFRTPSKFCLDSHVAAFPACVGHRRQQVARRCRSALSLLCGGSDVFRDSYPCASASRLSALHGFPSAQADREKQEPFGSGGLRWHANPGCSRHPDGPWAGVRRMWTCLDAPHATRRRSSTRGLGPYRTSEETAPSRSMPSQQDILLRVAMARFRPQPVDAPLQVRRETAVVAIPEIRTPPVVSRHQTATLRRST